MAPHPNSLKNLQPMQDAVRKAAGKPTPLGEGTQLPKMLPAPKMTRRKYRSIFDEVLKHPKRNLY